MNTLYAYAKQEQKKTTAEKEEGKNGIVIKCNRIKMVEMLEMNRKSERASERVG